MATALESALMTLAEFAAMPNVGPQTELVRGKVIELPPTNFIHGLVCVEIGTLLSIAAKQLESGRVIGNDSGVITHRNPDSVRGPDVAYYSNAKIPPADQWRGYPDLPPDLVVEVRSPSDRWPMMLEKAAEYLAASVLVVVILDPNTRSAHLFDADQPPRVLGPDDNLTFPSLLESFNVRVGSIFQ